MMVWVLKARFRLGGGYWVVEVFQDEKLCMRELELMQKSFPNHEFWVENDRIQDDEQNNVIQSSE